MPLSLILGVAALILDGLLALQLQAMNDGLEGPFFQPLAVATIFCTIAASTLT